MLKVTKDAKAKDKLNQSKKGYSVIKYVFNDSFRFDWVGNCVCLFYMGNVTRAKFSGKMISLRSTHQVSARNMLHWCLKPKMQYFTVC